MENRKWEIRYKTAIYHKSIEFQGTYFEAVERYSKIKWDNKVLWDITTIPELIKSSDGSGSGNVEPTISFLATSLEPEKRKRGRPRKVSNGTKIVIEKKKRGRPRKKPKVVIEKKKRGRPSKYSQEVLEKRGKGRPRKYGIEVLNQTEVKIVSVLISILEKAEKPVHTPLLLSQINKSLETSFAEPTLRRVINYIRGKSLSPIVCVNGTGYEITTSKRKIKEQIDSLNKRASSIVSSAHGLKKFL